jgi:ABC-type transport system involved in multi-copper enzyme maturation permease subunit
VGTLGISRIEYRPWKGKRTDPNQRLLVISRAVFSKNIKAKSVLLILIAGILLAHMFPILFAVFTPHEGITSEDMVGPDPTDIVEGPEPTFIVTGPLQINGSLAFNGTFQVVGYVFLQGDFEGGKLFLDGTIRGNGTLGYFHSGNITTNGSHSVNGMLIVNGMISGNGTIWGDGEMLGSGMVEGNDIYEDEFIGIDFSTGYLTSGLIAIFSMLLAAIICADIISADLANSSFVLYFSRPVRAIDYLVGKFVGLVWVMCLFTLIPPIMYVLVMMGTQSGSDYWSGVEILGLTMVAGLVTAIFFLPYGLMISSFTKRRAYAGIGIFMSFFVMSIISEIFREWNEKWILIDPFEILHAFYTYLFGHSLTVDISGGEVAASMLTMMIVPMVIVYIFIQRKGAGK